MVTSALIMADWWIMIEKFWIVAGAWGPLSLLWDKMESPEVVPAPDAPQIAVCEEVQICLTGNWLNDKSRTCWEDFTVYLICPGEDLEEDVGPGYRLNLQIIYIKASSRDFALTHSVLRCFDLTPSFLRHFVLTPLLWRPLVLHPVTLNPLSSNPVA